MMYFGNRRPRGFHHTFVYADERRDLLRRLRAGAEKSRTDGAGHDRQDYDRDSLRRAFCRGAHPGRPVPIRSALLPVLLLVLLVLALLFVLTL